MTATCRSLSRPREEPLASARAPATGRRHGDRLGDAGGGDSFRHAVELLQTDYLPLAAPAPIEGRRLRGTRTVRHLTGPFAPRYPRTAGAAEQVIEDYYHDAAAESRGACSIFERRGIGSSEMPSAPSDSATPIARLATECR